MRVSIVVPLYNESSVTRTLLERLQSSVSTLENIQWDLILVNDGSTDDTVAQIKCHRHLFHGSVKLISFSRNFGHQRALLAGIISAEGDAVISLDADLQDPPEMIPQFLEKFREGYDVVYGVRETRIGSLPKRLAYALFYRLFQRISDTPIPLDAGDFGLMSQRIVSLIRTTPERDVFLRGLRGWFGFKQIGLPYDRPGRFAGETKYSLGKLCSLAANAFFGFSLLPLRLATGLGFVTVGLSLCYAIYSAYRKLTGSDTPTGWASMVCLLCLLGGVQLITMGIIGEYIGRIFRQSQARPHFVIAEQTEL